MPANRTIYCLENLTDYSAFERFSSDLMSSLGYDNIEPLGAFKDKGRDALHVSNTNHTTIFAYSVREDWRAKLAEDANKIKTHDHTCDKMVFVTTSKISATKRDEAINSIKVDFGWDLEIYSQERLRVLIESKYPYLINNHPQIFTPLLFPDEEVVTTPKSKIVVIFDEANIVFAEWLIRKLLITGYEACTINHTVTKVSTKKSLKELLSQDAKSAITIISEEALSNHNFIKQTSIASEIADTIDIINLERNTNKNVYDLFDNPSLIPFHTDWTKGLEILLHSLSQKNIPKSPAHNAQYVLENFLNSEVILSEPEHLFSNTFKIKEKPSSVLVIKTKKKIPNSTIKEIKYSWAIRYINPTTFISFFYPDKQIVEEFGLSNVEMISWRGRETILGIDTNNLLSELLYKSIYRKCLQLGLKKCKRSSLYYFPPDITEDGKLHFKRPDGSKSHVLISGKRHYPTSNGPTPYKYFISSVFNISQNLYDDFVITLNVRYRFTDVNEKVLKGKSVNSRRKHLTSGWWNLEWFSRLLAIIHFLSDGESIIIDDVKDEERKIVINSLPAILLAPYGIDEKKLDSLSEDRTFLELIEDDNE